MSVWSTSTSNALASTVTTLAMVRIEADERSTPTIWLAVTGSTRYPPSAATAVDSAFSSTVSPRSPSSSPDRR